MEVAKDMDIGPEKETVIVDPVEDPFRAPAKPTPTPTPVPEPVPAGAS